MEEEEEEEEEHRSVGGEGIYPLLFDSRTVLAQDESLSSAGKVS